jgi:hypothetical protein
LSSLAKTTTTTICKGWEMQCPRSCCLRRQRHWRRHRDDGGSSSTFSIVPQNTGKTIE